MRSAKKPQVGLVIVATNCDWVNVIYFNQVAASAAAARLGIDVLTMALSPLEDQMFYGRFDWRSR